MDFLEMLHTADNVYRTKNFIVCQIIGIKHDSELDNVVLSQDAYFARTVIRDRAYEDKFWERRNMDGRRLPTNMYSRTYVD